MKPKPTYEELLNEVESLKEQLDKKNPNDDYRLFFENNEAIILFVDPRSQDIIFTNESAQKFYGYSKDEFSKMKISDIHTLTPKEIEVKIMEAKKKNQNYFQFKHKLANGEIKDVEVYQTKLTLHDKLIFSIIVFDITEKKKAESDFFESELKYRDYFEKDISGFYRSTPVGNLLYCNSAFADMLGYNIDELLKTNTSKLYPYKGNRDSFIDEIISTKNIHNKEIDLVKKNGEIIHCIENVAGIFDGEGNLTQFQGFIFNITERKKTEIALRESESRFKRLFEDLGDAVFVTMIGGKKRGDILEANPAAILQTGYSKEELLEMNIIRDIFVEGSGDISIDDWDKRLHSEDIVTTVEQKRKKDGTLFWTEVIVTPIEYNGVPASLSINHDITNRINSNKALEESERKFRELFEKSGDAFLIIKNRKFVDCNSAAIKMLGYNHKDEITNAHPSILSPDFQPDGQLSRTKADSIMSMCIEKGTHRFEWDHTKKNGDVFSVEVLLTAISSEPDNEIIHTVWRDITERNKAKDELINAKNEAERNEKKFRDLYEKSGDAVFILEDVKHIDCNQATLDMFGYDSKEEMIKLHPWDISPEFQPNGEQSSKKAIQHIDIATKKGTYRFEWDHMRKNGEVFPCEILLTAILSEKDKPLVHTVCRDITERRMNQQEIIKAKEKAEESDRLKSAFLANMSHEIRTPMNGILGFASLLKLPDLNTEQIAKYVSIIEKSGHRMLNIINDLMDISKIEAGQMEVNKTNFDLNEQNEYLYSFFLPEAEKKGLNLSYEHSLIGEDAIIYSDNEKLYAILANLLKNSIKYSNEGEINFGYTKKNENLIFHISDSGIGIPKERQKAVFDRFVQADIEDKKAMEGAGLGLAIAKAYVEMLGGNIWLESEEGVGTKFFFTVPYNQLIVKSEYRLQDNNTGVEKELESKKLKILIAEDEEFSKNYLQIILKNTTDQILFAKTGREVIDICKNNTDLDLILMDIKMPIMGGYEATKEIRKFNKNIIIIAQTAYALPGDKEKATEAGCSDYISKPIDKDELIKKIEFFFN